MIHPINVAEALLLSSSVRGQRVVSDVRGFSMVELLVTMALILVLSGMTVSAISTSLNRYRLAGAARAVAAQIRAARLTAVTTNRTMLVRFGCPSARFSRAIELTNVAAIDNAADRCSAPWPAPDADPDTLPNVDGPPIVLPEGVTFTATQDLRINTLGQVTPLTGATPALIQVTNGVQTRQITVSGVGRIQAP